jgi:UDPglucose--hexose-1-phosphate uridylyltransferase
MAELRLDPFSRRWVIIGERHAMPDVHDEAGVCPFCAGHEEMTPHAIREFRDASGAWIVRAFHDRAPLFRVEGEEDRRAEGMFDRMNTVGAHEIVVETPIHGQTLAQIPEKNIIRVIEFFRDRILDLKRDRRLRYISIFKDQHGPSPTLHGHAFSQVLATPVVPQLQEIEFRWSHDHFLKHDRCLYCDALQQERQEDKRIVDQTNDFVAFCPYGSRWAYELWIAPVRHSSSFEDDMSESGMAAALAPFLQTCLQRVERVSPSLHMVIHTEPNLQAWKPTKEWWADLRNDYHWHITIHPEIDGLRGYLGTEGFHFNPILPEQAAVVLKALQPGSSKSAAQ